MTSMNRMLLRRRHVCAALAGTAASLAMTPARAQFRVEISGVRYKLWDVVKGQDLGGQSYAVPQADMRLAAHRIADYIYEKLTGDRGVFSTRIAYVTKAGSRYTLWVADADGENAQVALASPEPIISPAWSPDGAQLAYVSFESRKPVVYVHDVSTGGGALLANFRGQQRAGLVARRAQLASRCRATAARSST
jgi:tol-pal system beta propeller repeat protein TolB